jgi:hypothetical protein
MTNDEIRTVNCTTGEAFKSPHHEKGLDNLGGGGTNRQYRYRPFVFGN